MKTETRILGGAFKRLGLATIGFILASSAAAQNYAIDWFKISGGGGTSTGGVFSVSGTIGQPDAGVMTGGNYTLQGGFWSLIQAVQTEGAPTLTILYPAPGTVTVSWELSPGWYLEDSSTLAGTPVPWAQVAPSTYQTNAGVVSVTVPITPGSKFYRLHKQ